MTEWEIVFWLSLEKGVNGAEAAVGELRAGFRVNYGGLYSNFTIRDERGTRNRSRKHSSKINTLTLVKVEREI